MPRHFPTTPPRGGAAKAFCRLILALLHLTMIATAHAAQQTLAIPRPVSRPYVASLGSPGLRFQEAIPPAPIFSKPIASGPPVAAAAPEVAEVNLANHQAAAATPPSPSEPATPAPAAETPPAKSESAAPPTPKPQPILPDETRRRPQSQDFLPLFRFPGASSPIDDSAPVVPAPRDPGTLPPSSATYRQQ